MSKMIVCGIGSRETPEPVLAVIKSIGFQCAQNGWYVRSGGAAGADMAFEEGAGKHTVVYLPDGYREWAQNMHPKFGGHAVEVTRGTCPKAWESVEKFHPAPYSLKRGARALMARNYCQIHGIAPTSTPVQAVVCWAEPEVYLPGFPQQVKGGTGQAVRIANKAGIPIFNLCAPPKGFGCDVESVMRWLEPAAMLLNPNG